MTEPKSISRLIIPAAIAAVVVLCAEGQAKRKPKPTAGQRVMKTLESIEAGLVESKYQHATKVLRKKGHYFFDCSGMAAWVLKRSAPRALEAVGRPNGRRPLAVHFYNKISKIEPGERRGPWERVKSAAFIRPGDVIAWKRPKWFPSKSTGHVAFAVGHPKINTGEVPGILIRIADSSKFKHENDSRKPDETGYGTGVLLLPTDENVQPLGYGWFGSETAKEWVVPADLVIGRPLR